MWKMLAAPAQIDRSMTNYWAGVSGKEIELFQDGGQIKREKDILSPRSETNIYHLPSSRPPLFLIRHYL